MMDVTIFVLAVVLAVATALVAQRKGQSGLLWFVLGLFLPGVGLIVAALLRPSDDDPGRSVPSVGDAARSSDVARALHGTAPRSAHEIQELIGADEGEVRGQLSALEHLGLAERDASGRWALTDAGTHHLETSTQS